MIHPITGTFTNTEKPLFYLYLWFCITILFCFLKENFESFPLSWHLLIQTAFYTMFFYHLYLSGTLSMPSFIIIYLRKLD